MKHQVAKETISFESFGAVEKAIDDATVGFQHSTPIIKYDDGKGNTLD